MFFKGFIFIYSIFLSSAVSLATPVNILVLDSIVDLSHSEIAGSLNEDLMDQLKFIDIAGEEKSWRMLNNELRKSVEDKIDYNIFQEYIKHREAVHRLEADAFILTESEKALLYDAAREGEKKFQRNSEYKAQLPLFEYYIHGTHVAGIIANNLTEVNLITLPFSLPPKKTTSSDLLELDKEKFKEDFQHKMEQISTVIQNQNIRVVNLSLGNSRESFVQSMFEGVNLTTKFLFRKRLVEVSHFVFDLLFTELSAMMLSNPNTVFVIAAGNDGENLENFSQHTAKIDAPNLLTVASLTATGKVSPNSNFSSTFVDIGAFGEGISSALIGGKSVHLSGTSTATPATTNRVAKIFEENPLLSSEEAIGQLLTDQTEESGALATKIIGGRQLIQDPLPNSFFDKMNAIFETQSAEITKAALEAAINKNTGVIQPQVSAKDGGEICPLADKI